MSSPDSKADSVPLWRLPRLQIAFAAGAGILNTLSIWRTLVFVSSQDSYFIGTASAHDYLAATFWTTLVAAGSYVIVRIIARSPSAWASWAMILLTGVLSVNALEYARIAYFESTRIALQSIASVGGTILVGMGVLAWFRRLSASGVASACAISIAVFAPFAATTVAQGLAIAIPLAVESESQPLPRSMDSAHPTRAATRVVWVIFDELDRRVLVDEDQTYTHKHLDDFRRRSIDATEAIPPSGTTIRAMPSFWVGRRIVDSQPEGSTSLDVRFSEDSPARPLSELDDVFRVVAHDGYTVGVASWYHPYCRLFRESLNRCANYYWQSVQFRETASFFDSVSVNANSLAPNWRRRVMVAIYEQLRDTSLDFVGDPDLDFVAIHLNVPHEPSIYDPATGELHSVGIGLDYEGNLVLADITLGLILDRLEEAGLSQQTAVIVGADHGWRQLPGFDSLPGAVPLITHLPGQQEGIVVNSAVEAYHTRTLILSLLRGEVSTPAGVASLLRSLSSTVPRT